MERKVGGESSEPGARKSDQKVAHSCRRQFFQQREASNKRNPGSVAEQTDQAIIVCCSSTGGKRGKKNWGRSIIPTKIKSVGGGSPHPSFCQKQQKKETKKLEKKVENYIKAEGARHLRTSCLPGKAGRAGPGCEMGDKEKNYQEGR